MGMLTIAAGYDRWAGCARAAYARWWQSLRVIDLGTGAITVDFGRSMAERPGRSQGFSGSAVA